MYQGSFVLQPIIHQGSAYTGNYQPPLNPKFHHYSQSTSTKQYKILTGILEILW